MRIRFENDASQTQRLHDSEFMPEGYYIEPNEDGEATVTEEVGEALLNSDTYDVSEISD